MEILNIGIITTFTYVICEVYKKVFISEKALRFIPILVVIIGGVLGVLIYYFIPSIAIGDNILIAIISGIASGLAATGTNQILKQQRK